MMRCLIVDDEPLARQLLESYIERIDELTLIKSCSNALEAFSLLQQRPVDLVFLDIEMPNTSGIELLKSLHIRPRVILTTAYRQYAFEAFDLDVIDYLLKPITFDRFLRGIAKIRQFRQYQPQGSEEEAGMTYEEAYLYLKVNRQMIKVYLRDIQYIESLRDYVRVKTPTQELITYQKISYLEQKLPQDKFVRIHRSFMVAIDKVVSFTHYNVKVGTVDIPIGRNYKKQAFSFLMNKSLWPAVN